jgi:hypothetical protein
MLRRDILKGAGGLLGFAPMRSSKSLALTPSQKLPIYLAVEGDSISAAAHSYSVLYGEQAPHVFRYGWATSGNNLVNLEERASTVDSTIDTRKYAKHILSVLLAVDLISPAYSNYGNDRAKYLAAVAEYLDARRTAGWKVLLVTTLPETRPGFNAERNLCNAVLRSWSGIHCDFLCDFAADKVMGPDIAAANTLLYYDGIHPTDLGHEKLMTVFKTALELIV